MPKRRRTSGGYSGPRRKIDKAIINVVHSIAASTTTVTLYTASESGITLARIVGTGEFLSNGTSGNAVVVIYKKPAGLSAGALSVSTGSQAYANDEDVLWQGLFTGLTALEPLNINIDVKGKRKLKNGDSIAVATLGSSACGSFSCAFTVFGLMP
jgi:hypothetical protein